MLKYFIFCLLFFFNDGYSREKKSHCIYIYNAPDLGRMGDYLVTYIKGKWFSYKYNIPLFIEPNDYYNPFIFSETESFLVEPPCCSYQEVKRSRLKEHQLLSNKDTNFMVSLFDILTPNQLNQIRSDQKFRKMIIEGIKPLQELSLITPPKGVASVAVHVRTGRGYDNLKLSSEYKLSNGSRVETPCFDYQYIDVVHRNHFLPEEFFAKSIKLLSEYLGNQQLYVYIFTDDPNPDLIKDRICNYLDMSHITIETRDEKTSSSNCVLSDFFSFKNFDYLIKPRLSNFSNVAEFLFNHKIVLSSGDFHWEMLDDGKYYLSIENVFLKDKQTTTKFEL